MEDIIIRGLAIVGGLVVLLALGAIGILLTRRPQPEGLCSCKETMGDDPDCPQHAQLAAYLQAEHERPNYTLDPKAPTHFEREVLRQMKQDERYASWGTSPHSQRRLTTAEVHQALRRRSRLN